MGECYTSSDKARWEYSTLRVQKYVWSRAQIWKDKILMEIYITYGVMA